MSIIFDGNAEVSKTVDYFMDDESSFDGEILELIHARYGDVEGVYEDADIGDIISALISEVGRSQVVDELTMDIMEDALLKNRIISSEWRTYEDDFVDRITQYMTDHFNPVSASNKSIYFPYPIVTVRGKHGYYKLENGSDLLDITFNGSWEIPQYLSIAISRTWIEIVCRKLGSTVRFARRVEAGIRVEQELSGPYLSMSATITDEEYRNMFPDVKIPTHMCANTLYRKMFVHSKMCERWEELKRKIHLY